MPEAPQDLSADYMSRAQAQTTALGTSEMEQWLAGQDAGVQTAPVSDPGDAAPQGGAQTPTPRRRPATGPLGTPEVPESTAGKVVHNIGEVVPSAAKGINEAVMNATAFLNPLSDWLDDNVVDTRIQYDEPKTIAGNLSKATAQFLTGFIPTIKGLKLAGMGGKAAGAAAGVASNFAVFNGEEGRLSDLWNKWGLPKNVLTDFLSSKPDDSAMEGRFKNAVEGLGLGILGDGVIKAASFLRGLRPLARAAKNEQAVLEAQYGKPNEEQLAQVIGDDSPVAGKISPARSVYFHAGADIPTTDLKYSFFTRSKEGAETYLREDSTKLHEAHVVFSNPARDAEVAAAAKKVGIWNAEENSQQFISTSVYGDDAMKVIKELERKGYDAVVLPDSVMGTLPGRPSERGLIEAVMPLKDAKVTNASKLAPRAILRTRGSPLPEDFNVYVNFNRIDAPDQVKFAMGKMAEAMKGRIDEATRGVITQKETAAMADDLGMTVEDLLARRKGQGFNAEEAVAARNLWAASGQNLVDLAKKAAAPNAGPLDQFAFRKAMAVHAAIQNEVLGARTETARALASWKIDAKGKFEQLRAINSTMEAMGGVGQSQEMARRLAILAENGASPAAIANFAQRGWGATTVDAIREAWVNGLLANPLTHAVNTTSNMLVAFQQIYERGAAAGIRQFVGGEGVVPGEATAMAYGMVESMKDAFRMAAKALKTGESALGHIHKVDIRDHSISAEAFRMSRSTGMGRFVDFLGNAVRMPTRLLTSEDEFFKSIGYRMELRAQALRQASQEGMRGADLARRVQEIVNNPPENIRINSADAALYSTFTNDMGNFGNGIMRLREGVPPLTLVIPFVRTPVNIARYAFERTPFAPLVGQWRADIAAGGARSDLALARMATGTAIMTVALDMADSGMITGAGPSASDDKDVREAMQRQGITPYSFKAGDRWYSYNRADPVGMTLGFAASIAEAVRKGEIDQNDVDEWNEVVAMSIAAVAQVSINKTYLEGFAKFVETMEDPQRYSQQYVNDMLASFTPMTGLMNSLKNLKDPMMRDAQTPMEAIEARIAGLSEKLPPRRDLWGQPLTRESGLGKMYDFISPIQARAAVNSPIDAEMVRLNSGPLRIAKQTSFDGVRANMKQYPQAYDTYVRLSGNDLKHPAWGMGARDFLNSVVTGKSPVSPAYKLMSDESRRDFIESTIKEYRKLAQQEILHDPQFRDFASYVASEKADQQQQKMPVLGE